MIVNVVCRFVALLILLFLTGRHGVGGVQLSRLMLQKIFERPNKQILVVSSCLN